MAVFGQHNTCFSHERTHTPGHDRTVDTVAPKRTIGWLTGMLSAFISQNALAKMSLAPLPIRSASLAIKKKMPYDANLLLKVVASVVASVASTTALAAYDQQEAQHECSKQAGDRKGAERWAFMKHCLTDKQPALHEEAPKQGDGVWLGKWVEGERGARTYKKIRITANTFALAPGGNSDYFDFLPEKDKLWCRVSYTQ